MPLTPAAVVQCTILNGASLSSAAHIGSGQLVGIILPVFTSAGLSFQRSEDGITYREAFDSAGAAIAVAASVGDRHIPAPAGLTGGGYIKVRSGTSGTPVNQGADRVISLIVK